MLQTTNKQIQNNIFWTVNKQRNISISPRRCWVCQEWTEGIVYWLNDSSRSTPSRKMRERRSMQTQRFAQQPSPLLNRSRSLFKAKGIQYSAAVSLKQVTVAVTTPVLLMDFAASINPDSRSRLYGKDIIEDVWADISKGKPTKARVI